VPDKSDGTVSCRTRARKSCGPVSCRIKGGKIARNKNTARRGRPTRRTSPCRHNFVPDKNGAVSCRTRSGKSGDAVSFRTRSSTSSSRRVRQQRSNKPAERLQQGTVGNMVVGCSVEMKEIKKNTVTLTGSGLCPRRQTSSLSCT
jgi:hypothetical protein